MAHVRALRAGPSRAAVAEAFERPLLLYGLLFVAAAAISGFTIPRGIDPLDEGLTLQPARRVADGELPYRDFLWSYGFAQPLLPAGPCNALRASPPPGRRPW